VALAACQAAWAAWVAWAVWTSKSKPSAQAETKTGRRGNLPAFLFGTASVSAAHVLKHFAHFLVQHVHTLQWTYHDFEMGDEAVSVASDHINAVNGNAVDNGLEL
jgi:hypothetical protein